MTKGVSRAITGSQLKHIRQAAKMSATEFGKKLGIKSSNIYNLESRRNKTIPEKYVDKLKKKNLLRELVTEAPAEPKQGFDRKALFEKLNRINANESSIAEFQRENEQLESDIVNSILKSR